MCPMKSLLFRLIVFSCFVLWLPSMVYAEAGEAVKTTKIESISYKVESETKESITFVLSIPVTAKIFTLTGEKPRLVIDFPDTEFSGKNSIPVVEGNFAKAIRIGIHQKPRQKIRVVVDLSKETGVRHSQVYSEDNKKLTIVLQPADDTKSQPADRVKKKNVVKLPAREELEKRPLDQKPVPPVFSVKEKDKKEATPVVTESVTAVPTILDVTFDDSSNRGEMVLLRLNDFYPPTVSAIEKDTPRVLCEFPNMKLGQDVRNDIPANGKYVERIRTQRDDETGKVKVILDLSPDRDYDLQQVFFKNDNLFVLIVNELPLQKDVAEGTLQN